MTKFVYISSDIQTTSTDSLNLPLNLKANESLRLFYFFVKAENDFAQVRKEFEEAGCIPEEVVGKYYVSFAKDPTGNRLALFARLTPNMTTLIKHNGTYLIYHGQRDWLILLLEGEVLTVNDQPISRIRLIRDRDVIKLDAQVAFRFEAVEIETFNPETVNVSDIPTCAFCLANIKPGELLIRCPACGSLHHASCWKDNGNKCGGQLGCPYMLARPSQNVYNAS